jgi:hypothetical protein
VKERKTLAYALLVFALFVIGGLWLTGRSDKRVLNERLKNESEKVVFITGQIADIAAQREAAEKALEKSQADSAAREKWFQAQVKKVETATPQELVDDGSRLLEASDITTDGKIVAMGLETWRRAVSVMRNEEEFRLAREPGWFKEKEVFQSVVAGLKLELLKRDERDEALKASIKDLKDYISAGKTSSVLEKILWTGAGFGFGVLFKSVAK